MHCYLSQYNVLQIHFCESFLIKTHQMEKYTWSMPKQSFEALGIKQEELLS